MRPEDYTKVLLHGEDLIVAEVRRVRQEIFARFDYDLDAYFEYLEAAEKEDRKRGVPYSDRPLANGRRARPDAT